MQLYGLARSLLTDPLFWVVTLLAVGMLLGTRRPAGGRRWVLAGLVILVLLGWRLPSNAVMHQLETWHPPAVQDPSAYAGVVVLGGSFESALLQVMREKVQLNAHAERLTEAVALAREHPSLPIVFTGGCVDTGEGFVAEAELAHRFFTQMGLAPDRVQYESASRTTFENALLTAQLSGVDKTQPWLLLTSAWHMPRAMATFQTQGWNVTPWPVDFRGSEQTPWTAYSLTRGVQQWQFALHECLGLFAYWVSGRATL
ncbi:YdcF family protein [Hydrogenophaga sp.]|uniref:YdcF family protein n=1 Tax=Hydrogenophaga sp. TaxID=1904254 RepID=UPI002631DD6D|nr:YdcF family protein [Hydrogenophaga sp.]MDM7948221.1 YdcF family protein [Hydrogenophaga sp.]